MGCYQPTDPVGRCSLQSAHPLPSAHATPQPWFPSCPSGSSSLGSPLQQSHWVLVLLRLPPLPLPLPTLPAELVQDLGLSCLYSSLLCQPGSLSTLELPMHWLCPLTFGGLKGVPAEDETDRVPLPAPLPCLPLSTWLLPGWRPERGNPYPHPPRPNLRHPP